MPVPRHSRWAPRLALCLWVLLPRSQSECLDRAGIRSRSSGGGAQRISGFCLAGCTALSPLSAASFVVFAWPERGLGSVSQVLIRAPESRLSPVPGLTLSLLFCIPGCLRLPSLPCPCLTLPSPGSVSSVRAWPLLLGVCVQPSVSSGAHSCLQLCIRSQHLNLGFCGFTLPSLGVNNPGSETAFCRSSGAI